MDETEATKPASEILEQEISSGNEQLERPAIGLLLSAVSAGLDIGFGPMMVAVVMAMSPTETLGSRVITALVSSIGFLIVIIGRSELFTEHTTLAVLPLFSGETTIDRVARLWAIVYVGNIAGVFAFAALAVSIGSGLQLFSFETLGHMATRLAHVDAWHLFLSAVAAGWLMGLVSWLVTAGRDTVGQILLIIFVTGTISFLHLHHSVAGSTEVVMGLYAGQVRWSDWGHFQLFATAGNAVGGVVLVGMLKFGHITQGKD